MKYVSEMNTYEQLLELITLAHHYGMVDAADFIRNAMFEKREYLAKNG